MECDSALWLARRELMKLEGPPPPPPPENAREPPPPSVAAPSPSEDESDADLWLSRRELRKLEASSARAVELASVRARVSQMVDAVVTDFDSVVAALEVFEDREWKTLLADAAGVVAAQRAKEEQKVRSEARRRAIDDDIRHEQMMLDMEGERRLIESVKMKERHKREQLRNRVEESIQRAEMHMITEENANRQRESLEAVFFKDFICKKERVIQEVAAAAAAEEEH